MTRQPNAPAEVIQQVAMLAAEGKSSREIEAVTGKDHSTVARWLNRDDVRQLINEGRARIAGRFIDLVDAYLDRVEAGQESLSGTPLMIQYGISQDKFDKVPSSGASSQPIQINFFLDNRHRDEPHYIEPDNETL